MAMTKSLTAIQASASNAAAGTTTSSVLDMRTYYGGFLTALITNGTAPTAPCVLNIQVSGDSTNWKNAFTFTAGTTASTAYPFSQDLPWGVMYVRAVFTGNTGNAVTVEAQVESVLTL